MALPLAACGEDSPTPATPDVERRDDVGAHPVAGGRSRAATADGHGGHGRPARQGRGPLPSR
ncbi:hypothetical protein LP422_01555 [Janibacter limosus]|uniref:Uncharacterized protein n=1 Tax=Janibacter limosus TaxID=53458 RepID=A0AC61U503_9MICO|nr:hypothetical protein [Janibacter limosus]UUZ45058.1 hypothetical protein LP422_01555 [Janibacter limosus]